MLFACSYIQESTVDPLSINPILNRGYGRDPNIKAPKGGGHGSKLASSSLQHDRQGTAGIVTKEWNGSRRCIPVHIEVNMATAQYERSGTRASAPPDPDPDPELRIKSPNSVPDPSVPDHRMQYLKSDVELGVRSIPVPYLFHTRSRQNKVLSTYSPCIIAGTSKRQSSFHTLRIKYAIQTLRIRQHRNVHSGHGVLISSHMFLFGRACFFCF